MVSQEQLGNLLFYSMRYACGRMTYAVDDVINIIYDQYLACSNKDKTSLYDDLSRELERAADLGKPLGSEYHHMMWMALLDFMRNNLEVT